MSESRSSGGAEVAPAQVVSLEEHRRSLSGRGAGPALTREQRNLATARRLHVGFPKLEQMAKLSTGRYYVLAARPGLFKTTLAWTWAWNLAMSGHLVLWVSLEMSPGQMAMMAVSRHAGIPRDALDAHFTGAHTLGLVDHSTMSQAQRTVASCGELVFHDGNDMSEPHEERTDHTLASVLDSMGKAKYAAVFVDYLQLVSSGARKEFENVSAVSKALAWHAHSRNTMVVALSQLNREIDKVPGTGPTTMRLPRLSDLRGSGQIEQDADAVMFLHDPGMDPARDRSHVQLVIEKNRYGRGGIIPLHARPEIGFIEEEG